MPQLGMIYDFEGETAAYSEIGHASPVIGGHLFDVDRFNYEIDQLGNVYSIGEKK